MNDAQRYRLPQGTERLLLDEAFRRQILTQRVQSLFTSWGYQPVQTPVFDFYDLYAPFLGRRAESVYRLVDREGDLLMLRSDTTLFVARAMGVVLSAGHEPLRVCYADTILRHQDLEDISANEFFQIGAEFIGSREPEGDLEVLLLLDELLTRLGLDDAKIHVGSRALFNTLFAEKSEQERVRLQTAVSLRQWDEVGPLSSFFSFQGSVDDALGMAKSQTKLSGPAAQALKDLLDRLVRLQGAQPGRRWVVDLSEVGRQDYYTGLVFRAYQPGVGDAVAAGGRYDKLLSRFGLDSPSVGFSLHLGKIEKLIDLGDLDSPAQAAAAPGAAWEERWKNARNLRSQGRNVTL